MNKLKLFRRSLIAVILCLSVALCGCGDGNESGGKKGGKESASKSQKADEVAIDYGNAEAFEAALNNGEKLDGKVVKFEVLELHPDSKLGFNIWAGEHLNFVSADNPGFKEGEKVTVRAKEIKNLLGSWVITYEVVDNGIVTGDTIVEVPPAETKEAEESKPETESEAEDKDEDEESVSESLESGRYMNNEYYEVVDAAAFDNAYGETVLVHKVLGKQNVTASATVLAYDADGNVVGKSENKIVLTEGRYNCFIYSFDDNVHNTKAEATVEIKSDSYSDEERTAVEMEKYNKSGDSVFLTLNQVGEGVDTFSKFKLLFYKGDDIVYADYGYVTDYAEKLDGKGTSDVAEVYVDEVSVGDYEYESVEFDRIEFIYEP